MSTPSPFPGAIPPPPGVTPNLNNPVNTQRPAVLAALSVIILVTSTVVLLRLYVKSIVMKQFKLADVSCFIGWLLMLGMAGIALNLLEYGMGIHGWDVSPQEFSSFIEHNNYHQIMYGPCIFFAKAAILLQFADIFVSETRNLRWWIIWGMIIFNLFFCTAVLFIIIFECNPRAKIWNPDLPGTCIQQQKMFVASSVINIVDDFVILILPMFWNSKLQIDTKRKIGVASIFAAGLFACITSIMRLVVSISTFTSEDFTYLFTPVAIWATAEVAAALFVACLPVLPRLFRRPSNKDTVSSKYGNTAKSRDSHLKSQSRYTEMTDDEVLLDRLDRLPRTQTSVNAHPNTYDPERGGYPTYHAHPPPARTAPEIYRTLEVNQTSEAI